MLGATPADERDRLLDSGAGDAILHAAWRGTAIYGGVIIRTRYTEDHVAAAVARGVRQYVIIGAGLDSFGMRQPAFARDLQVFEVDHPASQAMKRQRLDACGVAQPPTLHFVAADLSTEDLGDALKRSAFRFDEPAIFSWLGVTMYLTREANLATLRSIGRFAVAGSELVFTYIEQRALDSDHPLMQRARASAAALGEPWLSGLNSATLAADLRSMGLTLVEDLADRELCARLCGESLGGLTTSQAGRIALARVSERSK